MEAPLCEAVALGEFSPWARQLFNEWQSEGVVRLSFEPNVSKFCHQSGNSGNSRIVILENSSQSHLVVAQLRASHQSLLILWMGQKFLKEDLAIAVQHRVYGLLENPSVSDKQSLGLFVKAQSAKDKNNQSRLLIHSLKGLLLQNETSGTDKSLVSEMKAGLSKVENLAAGNEFFQPQSSNENETSSLPIAKSQTLSEVLLVMADLERTGTLWVNGSQPGQEGKIDFLQGTLASAEAGSVTQLKAIYRMFLWPNPRFLFNHKHTIEPAEPLIPSDLLRLVKEGEAQISRFQRIAKDIPPSSLKLDFVAQSINSATALTPQEFHALIQVAEFHYVTDILDYSPRWDIELFESLINLRRSGYINVATEAA